ncbi:sigma-70 family RNA polymerase sigma factor [Fulvivirga sp. M361]|uniref:RNA polymerase sigma factor n=1 Tax=Fulvivirga sp. M361 TaxID=2594266 RepID=UPI00117ADE55|nr:sigma-70 family RNA polymerase sigma factor [Fulvivirga sp. M361]TRX60148.1 sigma-70 family RNA polymerase sigma factor [Fulvivirga sp. M361]
MKSQKVIHNSPKIKKLEPVGFDQFSEKDEHYVWERFIKGDNQSLIYIYRKYADILYRYGRQFTGRSEFIRDCIQELFYDLIDRRSKLSSARSIKGYLFAALKRMILRDIKKEERLQFEEDGFSFSLVESSLSINPGLDIADYAIIQKKLNGLPVSQREVILLHFYEGLSYAEIADIMNIKVRSARALTYRALDSLEKELSPFKGSLFMLLIHFAQY